MKKVGLINLLILVILPALTFADETTYTGCLNAKSGVLKDVAMGQEPFRPCAPPYIRTKRTTRNTRANWTTGAARGTGTARRIDCFSTNYYA